MLIVLFIISLIFILIGYFCIKADDGEIEILFGVGTTISLTGVISIFIILVAVISCTIEASKSTVVDNKIAMYQEENKKIEKEITSVVNSYKDYEKEVISNTGQMVTILIKFPELKSNELVKKQLDVYLNNNDKIKSLKEEKIDYQVSKWWLYFGE